VVAPINRDRLAQHQPAAPSRRATPPSAVAGAVLRSARLSCGLSLRLLAAAADTSEATLSSLEDGSEPLGCVPAPLVQRLEKALQAAGAEPRLVADLTVAAWYDLVILAITESADPSCLLSVLRITGISPDSITEIPHL
jgi:transcriptional regulator with XRE-family HTH domain